MELQTLYKRTSTGAVQQWTMVVEDDKYWSVSGQVGGKLKVNAPTTAKPKNVGRSNETTGAQQAQAEAQAKFVKKQDRGYTADQANVDEAGAAFFKPMLAKEYEERRGFNKKANDGVGAYTGKDKVVFPMFIQPKLDGIRLENDADKALSRWGKPLGGAFNVVNRLSHLFAIDPNLKLDGELYNHEFRDMFEDLVSLIKKGEEAIRDDAARMAKVIEYVQYHVYDVPAICSLTMQDGFVTRFETFWAWIEEFYPDLQDILIKVPYVQVNNHEELDAEYRRLLALGYEGGIGRYDLPYEPGKKTWNLLKIKPFDDAEFELVDVEPGKGNWAGMAKTVTVRLEDGSTAGAGVVGTQEFARGVLENKQDYIGKTVTVRFQGRTKYGKLRFGQVTKWAREDVEGS